MIVLPGDNSTKYVLATAHGHCPSLRGTLTRYESVGCDNGNFSFPKYRIDAPQNECEITKKEVSLLALSK